MARAHPWRTACATILSRRIFEQMREFRHRWSLDRLRHDISRRCRQRPHRFGWLRTSATWPRRTRCSPPAMSPPAESTPQTADAARPCAPLSRSSRHSTDAPAAVFCSCATGTFGTTNKPTANSRSSRHPVFFAGGVPRNLAAISRALSASSFNQSMALVARSSSFSALLG
jgi:hypothetical protein